MKQRYYLKKLRAPIARRLRNGQWVTYGICLLAAAVFWYINKLDNTYSQEVNLRVKYINFPEDKVVMEEPVSTLQVGLRANGFILFQHVVGIHLTPFILNVSALELELMSAGPSAHYVVTQTLHSLIGDYYGTECEIAYIRPDTLWFQLDALQTRKIRVTPVLNLELEPGFEMNAAAMTVEPGEVELKGPRSMLDTIAGMPTLPLERRHVDDTLHAEVRLAPLSSPLIHFKQQKIKVTVPVTAIPEAPVASEEMTQDGTASDTDTML